MEDPVLDEPFNSTTGLGDRCAMSLHREPRDSRLQHNVEIVVAELQRPGLAVVPSFLMLDTENERTDAWVVQRRYRRENRARSIARATGGPFSTTIIEFPVLGTGTAG